MSVHQIRRALNPDLKIHAIGKYFVGKLHSNVSMTLQYAMAAGLEPVLLQDQQAYFLGRLELKLLEFFDGGGIILYVKDGARIVGVTTIGYCPGLRGSSFLVEDMCLARHALSVMRDRVYGALIQGVLNLAILLQKEAMGPILVHFSTGDSQRRLLKRLLHMHGFQEEVDAPGMWIARVKHGQEQLAVA
jgi:hypothetical protein